MACQAGGCRLRLAHSTAAEYAEARLFPLLDPKKDGQKRTEMWSELGSRHPELQASILAANPSWKAEWIPEK